MTSENETKIANKTFILSDEQAEFYLSKYPVEMQEKNALTFAVLDAVEAFTSLQEEKIHAAFNNVLSFDEPKVLDEIFLQINDATHGKNPADILPGVTLPLPPNPEDLLFAVSQNSIEMVQKIIGSEEHFPSVLVLLALLTAVKKSTHSLYL